jgi:hypothetical protein
MKHRDIQLLKKIVSKEVPALKEQVTKLLE